MTGPCPTAAPGRPGSNVLQSDSSGEGCPPFRIASLHFGWLVTEEVTMSVTNRPSTNGDLSDEQLMSELAAGRPEALGPLHGRYAALIWGLAARSLDRAAAEEISQEVFLAVWRHAATF